MPLQLDDFADATNAARDWSVFSDRVMGGISNARAGLEVVGGHRALRLAGDVSLERNGGFIQVARRIDGTRLGAAAYTGLRLTVCGTPGRYFVHLRTGDTRAPWQYYGAPLPVTPDWRVVELPWRAFTPESLRTPLDVRTLQRIGLVAAKTAFSADLAVSRLELVP